jgi:hypothetical protein
MNKNISIGLAIIISFFSQGCGSSTSSAPQTTASAPQAAFQVSSTDVGTYVSTGTGSRQGRNSNGMIFTVNADSSMTLELTEQVSGSQNAGETDALADTSCRLILTGIITSESASGSYDTFQYQVNSAALASSSDGSTPPSRQNTCRRGQRNCNNGGGNSNNANCTAYVNEVNQLASTSQWLTGSISDQGMQKE